METLSDTDEPSLDSRVADNLMVVLWLLKRDECCDYSRWSNWQTERNGTLPIRP